MEWTGCAGCWQTERPTGLPRTENTKGTWSRMNAVHYGDMSPAETKQGKSAPMMAILLRSIMTTYGLRRLEFGQ
jgi:hypothetical protein